MVSDIITYLPICTDIVSEFMDGRVSLLYYAHIPTFIVVLGMGVFVYAKGRKELSAKMFGIFTFIFALWTACNFLAWISHDSRVIMFSWALLGMWTVLFCVFMFYFFYVFVEKQDLPVWVKAVMAMLVLPVIVLTPTTVNVAAFDLNYCYAVDRLFFGYVYIPQIVSMLAILGYYLYRVRHVSHEMKKEMTLLLIGMSLFLGTFFGAGYLADTYELYRLEIYSLFAMTVLMGIMAYVIVHYRAFNIRLLGAQALVVTLVALIAAQFTFINNPVNRLLNIITLVCAVCFGWLLVRAVRAEVRQKEDAAKLAADLASANARLKALDAQKTEFLSIASHQLRTPLSIIKGYIELISDGAYGKTTKALRQTLENMDESNERLVKLVDEFLDITRLEQGRTKYSFATKNMKELIDSVVEELLPRAGDKGLLLTWNPKKAIERDVYMDDEKIRHVVFNFVDNAIKYTDTGSVTVHLESDDAGMTVRVVDTGIGFEKEDETNFFQKFYRGKNVEGTNVNGTGLGIYVCRKFLEAHGGRVWAKSAGMGEGSEFGFWLPHHRGAAPTVVQQEEVHA